MNEIIGGWGVRALATPTGKSISVSVRVVRDVRAVHAGGRDEAKLRGSVRAAMIPPKSEAAGPKCGGDDADGAWRRRCPAGARPVPGCPVPGARVPGARLLGPSISLSPMGRSYRYIYTEYGTVYPSANSY